MFICKTNSWHNRAAFCQTFQRKFSLNTNNTKYSHASLSMMLNNFTKLVVPYYPRDTVCPSCFCFQWLHSLQQLFQLHYFLHKDKPFIVDILKCEFKSCKNHSFIKCSFVCVCAHSYMSRILTWMCKVDCKICYFKNNTHKPDSSITVFPRVRYRLEKLDAWQLQS